MNEKLSPRFYGPFVVVKRIGSVAYRLDLPTTARIHPVFHVSLLKRCVGAANVSGEIPKGLTEAMELMVEPELVKSTWPASDPKEKGPDVLIHWKGLPSFEDSWESYSVI